MNTKNRLVTLTVFFLATALSHLAVTGALLFAQSAVYNGRVYTPANFSRANYCNCPMCQNIRSQWSRSRSVVVEEAKPVETKQDESDSDVEYKTETRYRTVTKYRTVQYQERQCYFDAWGRKRCRMVTRSRQVPYQDKEAYTVQVAVEKPKETISPTPGKRPQQSNDITDAPDSTPQFVVNAILERMDLQPTDTLWDIGSGRDARFLIAACREYGCRGVGIEINESHAEESRHAVELAGVSDRITIVTADALEVESYGAARKVVIYQFPDVQREIVQRLAEGTLVGTYAHEPDLAVVKRYGIRGHSYFIGVVGGSGGGGGDDRRDRTFGLAALGGD